MDQLRDLADNRLLSGCIYCNRGSEETRDHVPSRVFLDPPFPTNLPVVPACHACNNAFSSDEEYLACLIECAFAGSTDPDNVQRARIATILRRAPALRLRLEAAKSTAEGRAVFAAEDARVNNVIRKLAMGHAAFELSLPLRREPTSLMWWPLSVMTPEQRDSYDSTHLTRLIGEVGSRGVQRLLVTQVSLADPSGQLSTVNLVFNDWIDVQEGRYRYLAVDDDGEVTVRIVIGEFLACEVSWSEAMSDEPSEQNAQQVVQP